MDKPCPAPVGADWYTEDSGYMCLGTETIGGAATPDAGVDDSRLEWVFPANPGSDHSIISAHLP